MRERERVCTRERRTTHESGRTDPKKCCAENAHSNITTAISQCSQFEGPQFCAPCPIHQPTQGCYFVGVQCSSEQGDGREKRIEKEENINIQTSGEWGCECLIARVFGGSWTADVDFRCGCVLHTLQPRLPHRWHRLWIQKKTHQLPHHSHFDEWYMFRMPCAE